MQNLRKWQSNALTIIFAIGIVAFGILSCYHKSRLNKQIVISNDRLETIDLLGDRMSELEAELKLSHVVNGENNKINRARPQLAKWIYKHSKISRSMVDEILDNVTKSSHPLFLLALIKAESNFNPTAISNKGAMGLGQIMPMHEKALIKANILKEMRDVFNISIAVKATEFVWKMKMSSANCDINKALAMYLGGNNHKYVNQILKDYFQLNYLCKKLAAHKEISIESKKTVDNTREYLKSSDNKYEKKGLANDKFIYTIKSGDTLLKIAKSIYGEANKSILSSIMNNNPSIKNAGSIQIGQEIVLTGVYVRDNYRVPNKANLEGGD